MSACLFSKTQLFQGGKSQLVIKSGITDWRQLPVTEIIGPCACKDDSCHFVRQWYYYFVVVLLVTSDSPVSGTSETRANVPSRAQILSNVFWGTAL
jgi:hypothetical protein